jgi:hypothetical protein
MNLVLIAGLSTACVLTAVEGLLVSLGKFRGLVSLIFSMVACLVMEPFNRESVFSILASTFVGLTLSMFVEQTFTGVSTREFRKLPERVAPR